MNEGENTAYGSFTIKYESRYQDIVHVLISNGYKVTVYYKNNMITIEYVKDKEE